MDIVINNLKMSYQCEKEEDLPSAKNCVEALEKTLLYSKLFNCGIKEDKLHQQIFDLKLSKSELNKTIDELILNGTITKINNHIFINYKRNGFYSQNIRKLQIKRVRRILNFLYKLPFISMIAFSGGTSHYGILDHDDIDLFIITKPDSVYLVYFLIHVFSYIMRFRQELCANYLVDETNLKISHSFDFYTAHQIISLVPYKNPAMLNRFWKENIWIKTLFPNFNHGKEFASLCPSNNLILKLINWILMLLYRRYYHKKIVLLKGVNSFILTKSCMKLHINDNRKRIISEFKSLINKYYRDRQQIECQ